jgi:N-acetylneuraminic acid mutarotase
MVGDGGFFRLRTSITLLVCAAAASSIVTGTLLAYFRSEAPAKAYQRALTFAERVAYQRAIEEIYWRHRIWPKPNADPKPPLDKVMSQAQIEKKVQDYLRNSQALEDYWQRPITPDQLQAEMERMASHTKQSKVLRELFDALGNDPFVIAECLARPVLAERLLTNLYPHDQERLGRRRATAETQMPSVIATASSNYTLPAISDDPNGCTDDTWIATSITNAPGARFAHTAVWTGSEMIVWGGSDGVGYLNTGGRYNPSTDSWTATTPVDAPTAREYHTAVWTGSAMIVWGGGGGSSLNTGGRYNPGTDSWTRTSTTNAPSARYFHTAVWTGSEMIVWGGDPGVFNTGGRYNPTTDSWTATSTTGAPAGRDNHTAVWSGSEMIIWGGVTSGPILLNTGGRYNPSTDSWTATTITDAPDARYLHTAVWSGSGMIVWGGYNGSRLNTGGRYDPTTDSWITTSTANAAANRESHTAVWTDSEMIVWGGIDQHANYLNTGGRYDPGTDSWRATSAISAPTARYVHTAVWIGGQMIIWGGVGGANTGGRYCAQSGPTPTPTPTPTGCSVTSSACGGIVVGTPPTEFTVNLSDPVDPVTVDASDFTVNGIHADSATVLNGNLTIEFFFNTSPAVQGQNTMHIPAGAFNCGNGGVLEFTCTFFYEVPRATPPPRPHPTPAPRP